MLKRIVLLLALGAALIGCTGSGTTSTSGAGESVAPIDSGAASELPSEMPSDSGLEASPSAS
jgi:hypothetical protein